MSAANSILTSSKGVIPKDWKKYPVPSYVSSNVWMIDFAQRIKQLEDVRKSKDYGRAGLWLGGLFIPEAYVTASRQAAAQVGERLVLGLNFHKGTWLVSREFGAASGNF
jgi:hypothetical protein